MRSSAAARLLLAFALMLTLGVKAAWTRESPPLDIDLFVTRAAHLLSSNGLRPERVDRTFGTVIVGRNADCTLMISDYVPHGTLAEPLTAFARDIGPLRYAWRGELNDAAPKLLPLAEYYIQRELRRAGFRPARHPITAVAGSEGCDLARLPWQELAVLPS